MAGTLTVINGSMVCLEEQTRPVEILTDSLLSARVSPKVEGKVDVLPDDLHEMVEREDEL